ncbi:hypothetical protein RND81_13G208100 [Saponaria officinalis]|uniref:TSL-kinase interacting protein 1 n=1 Tax=Saponaria officinalis TaxID=3572 RepID=A0AAW1H2D0_SAPOF
MYHVFPGRKDVSTQVGIPPEKLDSSPDKSSKQGIIHVMSSDREKKMHHSSTIKLQLFPPDEIIRTGLEKDGHNPFLELTLSARKKISSVITHLFNKWGSSSIAIGELVLFPFDAVVENLTRHNSWRSSDIGITAADVHSGVGSPEIFRLRYGWISSHSGNTVRSHFENICSSTTTAASGAEKQAEMNREEVVPCITNGLTNDIVKPTASSEPRSALIHTEQAAVNNEALKPSQANEIENDTAVENDSSAEPVRQEEAPVDREQSQPSLLWSDLGNISIGGLLSEASLHGRSGSSRFDTVPAADSMDAFINQLNSSHASTAVNMPSSILDAEDTCHSFGLSKPASVNDFLFLGRGAFSGLSSQETASRPSRFYNLEADVQNGANGCKEAQKPNSECLPSSAGVYNNENSLGLSSIRWNDSLGPFDLPMIPRQITKDDSISLGEFVR